jgi:uncharacterized membrane protein HdeD (DUF308 family)
MSTDHNVTIHQMHLVGLDALRKRSGWFVGLGLLLIVFGLIALGSSVVFTLTTMILIGWLMVLAGALQTVHAFTCKAWGGFFVDLLTGVFSTVVGIMIVGHPGATAVALTLMIAMLLIIGGIFRIIVGIAIRFPNSIWILIHGVVNVMLGIAILRDWPLSGLWVIGLFVGIDMLFNGWSLVMLGLAAKRLPPAA